MNDGIGNLTIKFTSTFSITGIAAGTLIVIIGYHAVRPFAQRWQDQSQDGGNAYAGTGEIPAGTLKTPQGKSPAAHQIRTVGALGREGPFGDRHDLLSPACNLMGSRAHLFSVRPCWL